MFPCDPTPTLHEETMVKNEPDVSDPEQLWNDSVQASE